MFLRYEWFYKDRAGLVKHLACVFDWKISPKLMQRILEETSLKRNKERIEDLADFTERDEESLLHGGHIGSVVPHSWKSLVEPRLHKKVNELFADTLKEFGYET